MRVSILRMGTILKTAYLCLIIFTGGVSLAHAWTEPVEIDGDLPLGAARVVAVGETLHVIAVNPPRAWYLYSRDNGQTWSEPVIPIDTSRRMEMPDLGYSNGQLHLAWRELTGQPAYWQLYHASSSNGGRSWSHRHQVFNNRGESLAFPSLATNGDTLFLACKTADEYPFFISYDRGNSWSDSTFIDQGSLNIIQYPRLHFAQNTLHFIYPMLDNADSLGYEVYYKKSTNLGITWSDRIILSPAEPYPHTVASQIPWATVDPAGHILVTWMDYANGSMCDISGDIFYRVSLDNGDTWQPLGSITNTQSAEDSYSLILGNNFHVVWDDYWLLGCNSSKEAYSISENFGSSWGPPQFISGPDVFSESYPILVHTIQQTDTILHCFFTKGINGGELFYFRNLDFISAEEYPDTPLPYELNLSAYPNPFNAKIILSYGFPYGAGDLEIYNVEGRLARGLKLTGKQGKIIWDGKSQEGGDVSSGTYYVTLKAAGLKKTIQITLVR